MAILHSFAKPSSNNVLQPSLIRRSGCKTSSHSGLANVDTHKIMFIFLLTPLVFMYNVLQLFHVLLDACTSKTQSFERDKHDS